MSLPKQLSISTRDIKNAKTVDDLKKPLIKMFSEWQLIYQKIRRENEAYAWRTPNWRGYEDSNGDLVVEKWDGSSWKEGPKFTLT